MWARVMCLEIWCIAVSWRHSGYLWNVGSRALVCACPVPLCSWPTQRQNVRLYPKVWLSFTSTCVSQYSEHSGNMLNMTANSFFHHEGFQWAWLHTHIVNVFPLLRWNGFISKILTCQTACKHVSVLSSFLVQQKWFTVKSEVWCTLL